MTFFVTFSSFYVLIFSKSPKSEPIWAQARAGFRTFAANQTIKTRKSDKKCPIDVKFHAESELDIRITVGGSTPHL